MQTNYDPAARKGRLSLSINKACLIAWNPTSRR